LEAYQPNNQPIYSTGKLMQVTRPHSPPPYQAPTENNHADTEKDNSAPQKPASPKIAPRKITGEVSELTFKPNRRKYITPEMIKKFNQYTEQKATEHGLTNSEVWLKVMTALETGTEASLAHQKSHERPPQTSLTETTDTWLKTRVKVEARIAANAASQTDHTTQD
jgi:hypothetical protein